MNKKIKITKKQLNEVKERLVEEQIENVIKLPNFILNSIKDGRTSLGKHPSFPPEDEKRFEEKILLKRFMELGKSLAKINDLQQHDKQTLTNKLSEYVRKAIIIETPLRKELEKLCYDFVCGQFDLTPGELDITCELKDRIEPEKLPNVEPMLLDDTEFDDISSIDNLGKEIYKRRLINSLIQGASVRLSSEFNKIVNDLYELNPSLIELYHNILIVNEYLSFIKEVKPDNKNLGGFVSVDLSNPEPKISSEAVIFPVLVFETVKGIMELVASHGLPKNRREAEYVIGKADFSLAENWDKRFGVGLYDLFVKNIQNKKLQTEVFAEFVELEPERFFIKTKEVFANTKKGKEFITNLEKYITRSKGFDDIDKAIGVNNNDFNTFNVNTGGNDTDFYFEREDFNLGVDDGGYFHVDELGGLITDSVTTSSAGDYTYGVPLFGDEETLNHKDMIKNGQVKWNVRESKDYYDFYDIQHVHEILNEFMSDKENGRQVKKWRLIPFEQYRNALIEFVRYGEFMRFPTKYIDHWSEIVTENTMAIQAITELAGHTNHFPIDDLNDFIYGDIKGGENGEYFTNYKDGHDYLDNLGFYDWCKLPDGSDGWSDFGLKPLFKLIMELEEQTTPEKKIVVINKILDVYHQRGDLASAFIQGGSKALSQISGIEPINENIEHVLDKESDEYSEIHGNYKIRDYNKVHQDF